MPQLTQQLKDDLYILGIEEDPSEDIIHDIETLESMAWWNEWYENNGFKENVNRDYGGLNGLAEALGIKVDSNVEVYPQYTAPPSNPGGFNAAGQTTASST